MHQHPYFDLWLHDDAELSALLDSPLVERTTLHEWPLSCVQRIRTADGRSRIYKVQSEPTVEPAFYTRARSPLLVPVCVIEMPGSPSVLLLEEVVAPRLEEVRLSEARAVEIGNSLLDQIGRMEGDLPFRADISGLSQWMQYVEDMLGDLSALVEMGVFRAVDRALIDRLTRLAESGTVLAAIQSRTGYLHGDLTGDNVFVLPDGFRVIDWQRPIRGPVDIDRAVLLDSLGFDPGRHVPAGVVQLMHMLRIAWCAQCARCWFAPGATTYDAMIADLTAQAEKMA